MPTTSPGFFSSNFSLPLAEGVNRLLLLLFFLTEVGVELGVGSSPRFSLFSPEPPGDDTEVIKRQKAEQTRNDELATALSSAATATAVHGAPLPPRPLHDHPALHPRPEVLHRHRVDDHRRHALAVPLLPLLLLKVRILVTGSERVSLESSDKYCRCDSSLASEVNNTQCILITRKIFHLLFVAHFDSELARPC